MTTYVSASAPKWANEDKTAITLTVVFEGGDTVPFTATPDDVMDYGREIFEKASAGEFGEVAAYVPPSDETLAAIAQVKKANLMAAAAEKIAPLQDAVDLGDATEEDTSLLTAWKQYRVALNRIDQQEGYPSTISWPTVPAS